jgi:hypothetical protein
MPSTSTKFPRMYNVDHPVVPCVQSSNRPLILPSESTRKRNKLSRTHNFVSSCPRLQCWGWTLNGTYYTCLLSAEFPSGNKNYLQPIVLAAAKARRRWLKIKLTSPPHCWAVGTMCPRRHTVRDMRTVMWSNVDRRDQKMGVFLQSTEATPCCGHLKWKLTSENPLRTPCSWPPWPWFPREKSLNIFKVL